MTPFAIFSLPHAADVALTLATLIVGAAGGVGFVLARTARRRARRAAPPGRILLALTGDGLPCAAIDAAARVGRADHAIVVPAVLLSTPYSLPLDCPLQEAGSRALDLLEAVERRLARAGVQVDGRVVQGRTRRHAVRRLVEQERFDRLVVPAADGDDGGFSADDVAWLLAHVDGEVLVLRAGHAAVPPGRRALAVGSAPDVLRAARPDPHPAASDGGRRRGPAAAGVRP